MDTRSSVLGIRRERVPTSARTNDLCKCSICYPCLLSSFPPPSSSSLPFARRRFHRGRKGRETQSESVEENPRVGKRERDGERYEEETREAAREKRIFEKRRRRGPGIPEPGLDPRPSPPKSSTAARPQFRFVFSAPLCSFLLFSSLARARARARVSPFLSFFFFYSSPLPPSLFRPFLPDHGDNRPILRPLVLLFLSSSFSFFVRQCSIGAF